MNKGMNKTIESFAKFSRKAATEGMVLLQNNEHMLPILPNEEVAVFGRCQIDYYRSGTGSGGSVNVAYTVNAIEGFQNNNMRINEELKSIYEEYVKNNPFDNGGGGWASEPWFQQEMPLEDEIVKQIAQSAQKAIIIIGRTAGEEQDNKNTKGSYQLTDLELEMLNKVTKVFDKVAVVLNVSNIIDMSWLDNCEYKNHILSVIYSWHGGMEGGNALAEVVTGKVSPSGKMTDTIAYKLEQYPTFKNFGHDDKNYYEEDIYLGYRYFETFDKNAVRYAFGFGLSYTEFSTVILNAQQHGTDLSMYYTVDVKVTNIGEQYAGKEVVALYYAAPQGKLGKPAIELGSFDKTKTLKPGESQTITLKMPVTRMASYDDCGVTGHKSSYVLEEGVYKLFIGSDVQSVEKVTFTNGSECLINELMVVEELQEALAPTEAFKRMKPGVLKANGEYELEFEEVPTRSIDLKNRMLDCMPNEIEYTGDMGILLSDVKKGKNTLDAFIAQLSQKELEVIVRGEGMSSPKVTPGTAGAFGGVGDNLLKFGIPVACASDGPSGIRMDSGDEAVQIPIGTLLACSWNVDLMKELYIYEGLELVMNNIDTLLGPGMNIHRNPLNGRNFEYFSEDPYLTGCMAKAATLGLKEGGSTGTIKHFAVNDQEHERRKVDSIVSERALREIHLKGFEIAVREGEASSIMTAYNPINGIWAASNYDLNTTILRNEWKYTGLVMSDWWAMMNDPIEGGEATVKRTSCMVRAQNDVYMLVNNFGAEVNGLGDDLSVAIEQKTLSIAELQRCAINICRFILNAPVIDRPISMLEVKSFPSRKELMNEAIEENIISSVNQDVKVNATTDKTIWIQVQEKGEFSVVLFMGYDQSPSAQSACNVMLNGNYATNIQLNGTFGHFVREKNINVQLEKGWYKVDLEFTKPGLEIKTIGLFEK